LRYSKTKYYKIKIKYCDKILIMKIKYFVKVRQWNILFNMV